MKQHILTEEEIDTMVDRITNAQYDSVEQFFTALSDKFHKDATRDFHNSRKQLAGYLWDISCFLEDIAIVSNDAWKICKDKMEK